MALADNVPTGHVCDGGSGGTAYGLIMTPTTSQARLTNDPTSDRNHRRAGMTSLVGELFFNREKPKYCGRPLEMVLTANLQHFNLDAHHNQSTLFFVLSMFASFGHHYARMPASERTT
ncbi:hypothetical protein H257_16059 [Aphanomyces astaci]|uniref:Uncharacterized protein n=1 Tax=Aphanomyces astaci TaxID=112090 RepID=W4FJY4_APHAT|nr:hypothetical protein H257_16059 [Aphanomyces astaci]ETV67822.1 hypothetical protein H257_16059 [Aphanomyces astaci]|eukprot:XP_009842680.1 hypothetical protein H257_16059 [Aphanomyces astaci]